MTVFSLGLSIVQNFILGCQMNFILSSFHRPLLCLTLVLILVCWLGEVQWWCCESCIVVCMCAFELPSGGLDRRVCWAWVGLGCLFGLRPIFQGFTFPLAMFLASFLVDCVCWVVTAPGMLGVVSVGRWMLREDQIQEFRGEDMVVRVDVVLLVVRDTMTGMFSWASREDILTMEDFLSSAEEAFAWLPAGSPAEAIDVVFIEYLGYAREDFSPFLVAVCMSDHVAPRAVLLLRWIERGLRCRREATVRRCVFHVTGSAVI
jgi:hypothetical protein